MKSFIVALSLITSSHALASFTKSFKGEIPSSCEALFEASDVRSTNPAKEDMANALRRAINLTKTVMDLKFESHAYMRNNSALYGDFAKQVQMKKNIDESRSEIEGLKAQMIAESDKRLAELLKIPGETASVVYQDMLRERYNEMIIYNNRIYALEKEWKRNKTSYYRAYEIWAPYENNLKNLEKVEEALQKSLKNLETLHQGMGSTFAEIITILDSWRPENANGACKDLNQKLRELSEKTKAER